MDKSRKHDRKDKHKKKHKRSNSCDTSSEDERRVKSKRGRGDESPSNGDRTELSIEETNVLRAKLGLKPLQIDKSSNNNVSAEGNKIYHDKDTSQTFEHKPASNQSQTKVENLMREKLKDQREKRLYQEKLSSSKKFFEEDEDESAQSWVEKVKQKQLEKEAAVKKAKLLEEMDNYQIEDENVSKPKKSYTARDLAGLSIEHSQEVFREEKELVLTLKDKNVLDEDNDDVLVNVNVVDDEKAKRNIENLKKKSAYKAYDDFDDDGKFQAKSILDKYDEEIDGEKKKSFRLGTDGSYSSEMDEYIRQHNDACKAKAIRLNPNDFKISADYMTKDEEALLFKKSNRSKKTKLRSTKSLKADDLLSLAELNTGDTPVEPNGVISSVERVNEKVSLKNIDFEMKSLRESDSDDDHVQLDEINNDFLDIKVNDDAFNEMHDTLTKLRNRTIRKNIDDIAQKIIEERDLIEKNLEKDQVSLMNQIEIINDFGHTDDTAITIDSMSEFVRNLGETSSNLMKNNRTNETKSKMDVENDEKVSSEDEFDTKNDDMDIDSDQEEENDDDRVGILDDEPLVNRGLASTLKLAVNKGYLDCEKIKQNARYKGEISAKNFYVEEKNFYDIDDKYSRTKSSSDRYTSGPLSEFKDKEGYKPDIKLEYNDESGRNLNEKEAFRYLSHKFHGKGSGKKKTEKRIKKQKEAELMNKMSSIDTPLNTVALLQEKQKKLQQPFVVLSAPKGSKLEQITLKKP